MLSLSCVAVLSEQLRAGGADQPEGARSRDRQLLPAAAAQPGRHFQHRPHAD